MVSRSVVFWEVDTQADFMLPGGKLYVPGAERRIPNMKRLTDAAREGRVLILGDACTHALDDPEFEHFPPHCIQGTPGAAIIPEALAEKVLSIPNRQDAAISQDLSVYQQIILEKCTLNVFDNPNTETILERIANFTDADAEFCVFGVVTEYCVRLAGKGLLQRGRRVAIIDDAIETLNPKDGQAAIQELKLLGAQLISTDKALAMLDRPKRRSAP